MSTITEIEDVTYVCSPYIPRCIQTGIPISEMPRNNRDIAAKVRGTT